MEHNMMRAVKHFVPFLLYVFLAMTMRSMGTPSPSPSPFGSSPSPSPFVSSPYPYPSRPSPSPSPSPFGSSPYPYPSGPSPSPSPSQYPSTQNSGGGHAKKRHFVLVHGGGHGAWCWYKVATLLKSIGYNVTALDMTGSGIDPTQVQDIQTPADYDEPLMEFMASLPPHEKVILVAHSKGGASISVAMETFPHKISAAVFASALMPGPTLSFQTIRQQINGRLDYQDSEYRYDNGPNNPPTSFKFGPKVLAASLYQLSPPEDLTLALTVLRFSPLFTDEMSLTEEKYGSVSRVFIVLGHDLAIPEDVQRWMIANNPVDEVRLINSSDHMVMLSRPVELFSHLHNIAQNYS